MATAFPSIAAACPVCYGSASGPMLDGVQWSVAFLGVLVYGVFAGAGGVVFALRRRVRRLQDPRHGLKLVAGSEDGAAAGEEHDGEER